MKKNKLNKGVAPIIILLIIAILAGGGGVAYLVAKKQPINVQSVKENILGGAPNADKTLSDMNIETSNIDISLGALPALNVPSLDLGITSPSAPKVGSINTKVDVNVPFSKDDIKFKEPDMSGFVPTITMPSIPITGAPTNIPTNVPTNIPTNIPTGAGGPPANIPTGPTDGQGGTPSNGAPAIDCGQFASVPSCSMTGPGEEMCRKCFPNK